MGRSRTPGLAGGLSAPPPRVLECHQRLPRPAAEMGLGLYVSLVITPLLLVLTDVELLVCLVLFTTCYVDIASPPYTWLSLYLSDLPGSDRLLVNREIEVEVVPEAVEDENETVGRLDYHGELMNSLHGSTSAPPPHFCAASHLATPSRLTLSGRTFSVCNGVGQTPLPSSTTSASSLSRPRTPSSDTRTTSSSSRENPELRTVSQRHGTEEARGALDGTRGMAGTRIRARRRTRPSSSAFHLLLSLRAA